MFKVLILAVTCFIVTDARKLNRFYWDDDSDFDLTKRKSGSDVCEPEVTGQHYGVIVTSSEGNTRRQENLPEITGCKIAFKEGDARLKKLGSVRCERDTFVFAKDKKIVMGCKAVV